MNLGSLLQRTDGGLQFLAGSINGPANCRMTASGARAGHSLFTTEERHKSVSIHDQNGHRLEAADCPGVSLFGPSARYLFARRQRSGLGLVEAACRARK